MVLVNEIIGYVGMLFILVSFLMKDIKWLRLLNVIGGSICCIYGFLTQTYATAILNLLLVMINVSCSVKYIINRRIRKEEKEDENC